MTGESGWAAVESPAPAGAGYDLRPLSTGEVLDRTFQLYRGRFALFAGLAALPAAINFVGSALQVLLTKTEQVTRYGRTTTVAVHNTIPATISVVTMLVSFVLYGITQAATTWAVAEIYLGKPASIGAAWRTALARWFLYVRVVLRQYWSVMWLPMAAITAFAVTAVIPGAFLPRGIMGVAFGLLVFGSVIYAIYAAIRVSLAIPASVIESLGANASVRRSMALLTERKVRIFLMWLLVIAIGIVALGIMWPLTMAAAHAQGGTRYLLQMLYLAGIFVSNILAGPVGAIALCLFYFDERVRHEGFDIEFLMQRAGGPGIPPASPQDKPLAEGSTSPGPA